MPQFQTMTAPCPVPLEQQPLNEYESLRAAWFFRWATLDWQGYLQCLLWVWLPSWLLAGPIAAASFKPTRHPLAFLLWASLGAFLLLLLVLSWLYLGWGYVRDRLVKTTISYEESGWYDGQQWAKPPEMLTRDRLIVTYQVQPILRRLQWSIGGVLLITALEGVVWSIVSGQ
jgi:hypothetical protein